MKRKYKKLGELHAYHESDITRKRILRMLNEIEDLKIMCTVLNKKKIHIDLQNQRHYLYNYTANILLENLYNKNILSGNEPVHLFVDRKDTKKKLREDFLKYLTESVNPVRSLRGALNPAFARIASRSSPWQAAGHSASNGVKGKHSGKLSVVLHSSHENKSLQAVDFISWAIFRKYERNDYEFYEIIKNRIIDERLQFP